MTITKRMVPLITFLTVLFFSFLPRFMVNWKMIDLNYLWIVVADLSEKNNGGVPRMCAMALRYDPYGMPFVFWKYTGSNLCSKILEINILGFLINFLLIFFILKLIFRVAQILKNR